MIGWLVREFGFRLKGSAGIDDGRHRYPAMFEDRRGCGLPRGSIWCKYFEAVSVRRAENTLTLLLLLPCSSLISLPPRTLPSYPFLSSHYSLKPVSHWAHHFVSKQFAKFCLEFWVGSVAGKALSRCQGMFRSVWYYDFLSYWADWAWNGAQICCAERERKRERDRNNKNQVRKRVREA